MGQEDPIIESHRRYSSWFCFWGSSTYLTSILRHTNTYLAYFLQRTTWLRALCLLTTLVSCIQGNILTEDCITTGKGVREERASLWHTGTLLIRASFPRPSYCGPSSTIPDPALAWDAPTISAMNAFCHPTSHYMYHNTNIDGQHQKTPHS